MTTGTRAQGKRRRRAAGKMGGEVAKEAKTLVLKLGVKVRPPGWWLVIPRVDRPQPRRWPAVAPLYCQERRVRTDRSWKMLRYRSCTLTVGLWTGAKGQYLGWCVRMIHGDSRHAQDVLHTYPAAPVVRGTRWREAVFLDKHARHCTSGLQGKATEGVLAGQRCRLHHLLVLTLLCKLLSCM